MHGKTVSRRDCVRRCPRAWPVSVAILVWLAGWTAAADAWQTSESAVDDFWLRHAETQSQAEQQAWDARSAQPPAAPVGNRGPKNPIEWIRAQRPKPVSELWPFNQRQRQQQQQHLQQQQRQQTQLQQQQTTAPAAGYGTGRHPEGYPNQYATTPGGPAAGAVQQAAWQQPASENAGDPINLLRQEPFHATQYPANAAPQQFATGPNPQQPYPPEQYSSPPQPMMDGSGSPMPNNDPGHYYQPPALAGQQLSWDQITATQAALQLKEENERLQAEIQRLRQIGNDLTLRLDLNQRDLFAANEQIDRLQSENSNYMARSEQMQKDLAQLRLDKEQMSEQSRLLIAAVEQTLDEILVSQLPSPDANGK